MNALLLAAAMPANLPHLLITFLVLLIVIVVIGGLIWAIETYIMKAPLPQGVRLVIGLILILLVVIWAVAQFYPGA